MMFIWRPLNRCLCIGNYLNTQARPCPPLVLWDLPVLRWGGLAWLALAWLGLAWIGFFVVFSAESSEMGIESWTAPAIPHLPVQLPRAILDNPSVCVGRGNGNWGHWILLRSTAWCPTAEGLHQPPQTARCLDPWATVPAWAMQGHGEISQNDSLIPRLANALLPILPYGIRGFVGFFWMLESSGGHQVSIIAGLSSFS